MKAFAHLVWTILAAALLALPLACGGGGGGDGDTTVAASSTQVGQAVLVAAAAIDATGTAIDTGTGAVTGSSLPASGVAAAAMGMGGVTPSMHGHFADMGGGSGDLDLVPTDCDGVDSGTVATHMRWANLNPETLCVDGLTSTFTLDDCTPATGQSMDGQMGMTFTGSTCGPSAIGMDFSGITVTAPDGTLSGNFTMTMTGMMFAGDPAELDITAATFTFDRRMQMAGTGFGTVDMDMDGLAFHFNDATATGDLNGTLTVRCNGQAFPMTMATDANGLTLDADGNVVAGHMIVTSEGTTHTVTFNRDGSIDVAAGGERVHLADLADPEAGDFCAL
jgi:hypothetical protein